jgi:hypothetical protein
MNSSIRLDRNDITLFLLWIMNSLIHLYTFNYILYFSIGFICLFRLFSKFRLFQPGLLLIIFISTYLFYLIPVFFFDVQIAGHIEYAQKELYLKTLSLFIFFLVVFNLFLKKIIKNRQFLIRYSLSGIKSTSAFYLFFLIQIFILIYGFSIGSVIIGQEDSYEVYRDNLKSQNGLWEYFYIVYILSYLFSYRTRLTNNLLFFSFLFYCYISLTRGYRIQMIEMIIIYFILFLDGRFKNTVIIVGSFFALILMEIFGILKNIGKLSLEQLVNSINGYSEIYVTNQTEVFYSTSTMLGLAEKNILTFQVRFETFVGFIVNLIVPSGFMWDGSRLLDHIPKYAVIGGGGFCFGYTYFWLGYLGIFLLALYLGMLFSSLLSKNNFLVILIIMTIGISPRWFAYEPTNHLFRMELLLLVVYFFTCRLIKVGSKN